MGRIYYTTTNRQKNSEFDIRGHRDWEIASISLQSIEDKRAFLHKELSLKTVKKIHGSQILMATALTTGAI